jgi:ubiquinone/menaquinone biosynthesis C-methylase UbiE
MIETFVEDSLSNTPNSSVILDAGCGDFHYTSGFKNVVSLDIREGALHSKPFALAGDVQNLPFRDSVFDVVVCVGSVLNYVDLDRALPEILRVARPGGIVILEYERSRSCMSIPGFGLDEVVAEGEYRGVSHELRLYGDSYVDKVVHRAGLADIRRQYFHVLTPWLFLLTRSYKAAAVLRNGDRFRLLPGYVRALAANALIRGRKLGESEPGRFGPSHG